MTNGKTTTNGRKTVMVAGLALLFLLVADATMMTSGPVRASGDRYLAAQDASGEEKAFLEARSLINQTRWVQAADALRSFRKKYPKGRYVSDSFYWEAFARHRQGQLTQAVLLLDNMLENVPDTVPNDGVATDGGLVFRRINDARQLRLRILGEMAERGDSRAAQEVLRQSDLALGPAWDSAAMAWDSAATVMSRGLDSLSQMMLPALDTLADVILPGIAEVADSIGVALDSIGVADGWDRRKWEGLVEFLEELEERWSGLSFQISYPRQVPEHCEDESVQQEALAALMRLETARIEVLRSVIQRDDECSANLRDQAVERLSREGTPEAERELINVAITHPDPETRRSAVRGLRRYDTPAAVDALVNVLTRSDDAETQEAAIQGLRRSEDAGARSALGAFAADAKKPESLREDAIVALGRRNDVEADFLIRLYPALDTEKLKAALIGRLRRIAEKGNEPAETWLFNRAFDASESADIRSQALDAWSRSPSLELSGLVQAYGRLEDSDLRERIFYALYRKADRSEGEDATAIVRKMIELARAEGDREVRERAVYWLGRTGSPEAAEFLLDLVRGLPGDTVPKTGRSGLRK